MKNKKVMVLLLIINVILIGGIYNLSNKNIKLVNERQNLKEMTTTEKEQELENKIDELNESTTEYANYVQSCKSQIASAITQKGIATSETDSIDTMVENINKMSSFEIISLGTLTFSGFSGTVTQTVNVASKYENYGSISIDNFIKPNASHWAGYNYSASGITYSASFNSWSYNSSTGVLTVVFNLSGTQGNSGNYANRIVVPIYMVV